METCKFCGSENLSIHTEWTTRTKGQRIEISGEFCADCGRDQAELSPVEKWAFERGITRGAK